MEKGREQGALIGKIQLLEQLLEERPTLAEDLLERSLEELNSLVSRLQERLRRRGRQSRAACECDTYIL